MDDADSSLSPNPTPSLGPKSLATPLLGQCRCGNLQLRLTVHWRPAEIRPRACDCDFCRARQAVYVSDPAGRLHLSSKAAAQIGRERQGAVLADFLRCTGCDTLVAVCFTEQGHLYAAVNARTLERFSEFAEALPVSPKQLTPQDKISRWKQAWFADVQIDDAQPASASTKADVKGRTE